MKFTDFIGTSGPQPIPEFAAEGETERVYHEIRQTLRVSGVNLIFRTWAGFGKFLPMIWDELRPNLETAVFEEAANQLREEAGRAAIGFAQADLAGSSELGESRAWQVRAALDLYDYINPKLLVLTSAIHQALQGVHIGSGAVSQAGKLPRGEPARMYPMEMEEEKSDDRGIRRTFKDIRKTLLLPNINSDFRTLALWPDYLDLAWQRLKPIVTTEGFNSAAGHLRDLSRNLARTLPFPISMTMGRVKEIGEDPDKVRQATEEFEQLLPSLILNIATLKNDWRRMEQAPAQPEFPKKTASLTPGASSRDQEHQESRWRTFQKRQRLAQFGDRFVSYIDEGKGEPVLLLHGIPTWGFIWESTIASLSSRYRVIAPDLIGYGYSDKRDAFDRSLARQTEMLDQLLGRLGIESAHFVGHDLGGGIALRFATLLPKRVRSVCVMNSVCYDSWPVEFMLQLGLPANYHKLSAAKTAKALRQSLAAGFNTEPTADWFDGLLSPWRTEIGKLSLIRNAAALDANQTTEITRLLPGINVPTLIIWGEDDQLLPVKYGERLAKDIPGANLVRIAGARHFVMVDQPQRVQATMNEFYARHLNAEVSHRAAA